MIPFKLSSVVCLGLIPETNFFCVTVSSPTLLKLWMLELLHELDTSLKTIKSIIESRSFQWKAHVSLDRKSKARHNFNPMSSLNWFLAVGYVLASIERSPPLEEVIKAGVVSRFVGCLMTWLLDLVSLCFSVVCPLEIWCLLVVWGCMGSNKHCLWDLREQQGCNWS